MRLASQQPLPRAQMEEGLMGILRGGRGPHLLASAPQLRLVSGGPQGWLKWKSRTVSDGPRVEQLQLED